MEIIFLPKSKEHLDFFKKVNNPIILKKIRQLIEIIPETPYSGIGKPEPLKHHLSGLWSRRINQEHRLVYEVIETDTVIF